MKVPDLEADIEYEEDFEYLYTRSTYKLNAEKLIEFWRSLTREKLHEMAVRAREYHSMELIQEEGRKRDAKRKAVERNYIIKMGIGR